MRRRPQTRPAATSRRSAAALSVAALLLGAGASGCASAEEVPPPVAGASAAGEEDDSDADEDALRDARDAVEDARRQLAYAEAEREAAGLGVEVDAVVSAEKERSLDAALQRARATLDAFRDVELGIARDDAALDVEDARDSLVTAQTDLDGLEDIFAEEAEATAKPEILRRGRRRVERAEARLSMQERRSALAVEHELPMKLAKLEEDVVEAEAALAAFRSRRAAESVEARLKLRKAADALDEARRDLERAEEELRELIEDGDDGDSDAGHSGDGAGSGEGA